MATNEEEYEPDMVDTAIILLSLYDTAVESSILLERQSLFLSSLDRFNQSLDATISLGEEVDIYLPEEEDLGVKTLTASEFASLHRYRTSERVLVTELCFCLKPFKKNTLHICLDNCKHRFHIECIYKWLSTYNRSCPVCRTEAVASNQ